MDPQMIVTFLKITAVTNLVSALVFCLKDKHGLSRFAAFMTFANVLCIVAIQHGVIQ